MGQSRLFKKKEQGEAVLEYVTMLMLVMAAFIVIDKYAMRAMSGRWKAVGDSFDMGRQYDPLITKRGAFDFVYTDRWYNQTCFDSNRCSCAGVNSSERTCQECLCFCVPGFDGDCEGYARQPKTPPDPLPETVCDWETYCAPSGSCCDHDGCCEPEEAPDNCLSDCPS